MMALPFSGCHLVKTNKLRQLIDSQERSCEGILMNESNKLPGHLEYMASICNKTREYCVMQPGTSRPMGRGEGLGPRTNRKRKLPSSRLRYI